MKAFNSFIEQLKQLTDDNNHGAALLEITSYYGMEKHRKIIARINEITIIEGYLPQHLANYRYEIYQQIMTIVKTNSPDEYHQLFGAL